MTTHKSVSCLSFLLSLIGFVSLSYFTDRTDFTQLILIYSGTFLLFWIQYRNISGNNLYQFAIVAAILFRASLLFSMPNLSDDFYRFIWDGRLAVMGINPMEYTPVEILKNGLIQIDTPLFDKLNSQDYYTVYPPVNQFIFYISAFIFPANMLGNVVVMKIFMLLFEMGSIFLIAKLLMQLNQQRELIFLYALNPLVIIELTGNLHFEAGMIFFTLLAVYLTVKNRIGLSGVALSLAIATKLWPLIFIPFFLKRIGIKKSILLLTALISSLIIFFLPLIKLQYLGNFFSSISLYFNYFEFNSSIYYLLRWLGNLFSKNDTVNLVGVYLPIITIIGLILLWLINKNNNWQQFFLGILFALTIFFMLTTTIHPWYLTPLVALALFTKFRFPFVWATMIPFTYITYNQIPYEENYWIIVIEYGIVFVFLLAELLGVRQRIFVR